MNGWSVREDCGVCLGFTEGAHCKQEAGNESPRELSEQLCVMGLVRILDRHENNKKTHDMQHVWTRLETSLAAGEFYSAYAAENMDIAFQTIDHIIKEKAGNVVETFEAVSLKNFEGLFRARATGAPITPELILQTRNDIGALICTIDEINDAPPEYNGFVSGFMSEQIVTWLGLYSENPDNVFYPTSDREGKNDYRRLNHDRYKLIDGRKVPIEIKRRHRHVKARNKPTYDKPIIKVVLQDILDQTASVHGGTKSRRDNFLIDYIRFDLSGRDSPSKRKVLRTASTKLLSYIERHEAERETPATSEAAS